MRSLPIRAHEPKTDDSEFSWDFRGLALRDQPGIYHKLSVIFFLSLVLWHFLPREPLSKGRRVEWAALPVGPARAGAGAVGCGTGGAAGAAALAVGPDPLAP